MTPSRPMVADDSELEAFLWQQWHTGGQLGTREQLVRFYSGWAHGVARRVFVRVRARPGDWQDFHQNALLGLLQAIDGFQATYGVPFTAYATQRVRGAVFNGMRELRSTSSPQSGGFEAERVASLLDATGDALDQLIEVVGGLALGSFIQAGANGQQGTTPYDHAEQSSLQRMLRRMLNGLPERERSVLELHYLQFVPFVRISEILQVSKGRISQLHRQGLDRMRQMLAARRLSDVL